MTALSIFPKFVKSVMIILGSIVALSFGTIFIILNTDNSISKMLRADMQVGVREAVKRGILEIPHIQEIKSVFPGHPVRHSIPNYRWADMPYWQSEVYFASRYRFVYIKAMEVDYESNILTKSAGEATFFIYEYNPAQSQSSYSPFVSIAEFDEEDWAKVVAAKGDFSVINIQLKMDSPVPGFSSQIKPLSKKQIEN